MSTVIDELRRRMAPLEPDFIDISDESAQHVGHAGASQGGKHLRLTIVSDRFTGLTPVARHRLVYQFVTDMIPHPIHALAINAIASNEN